MPTTTDNTQAVTKSQVQHRKFKKNSSKQLVGPFMANLLPKRLKCPKTDHLSEKHLKHAGN